MKHFVFCHGFGFDLNFWNNILPYFSKEKCSFIDLGYFKHRMHYRHFKGQTIIGIGHSIGLSKLIYMYNNFSYLIGLNGFVNFLGYDQTVSNTRKKELKALHCSFLKDPDATLRNFYTRCGTTGLISCTDFSNIDSDLILSDFVWLEKTYELPLVPTLILGSNDDMIVSNAIISDNFSKKSHVKVDSLTNAGHGLGFNKPLEVYEKIMGFLNDSKS